jgi:hypothetical protein
MGDDLREWQREYLGQWCPSPVEVQGHLVRCSLGEGHDGECRATKHDVVNHQRGGKKVCVQHGCGQPTRSM